MQKIPAEYSRQDLRGTLTQVSSVFPTKQINVLDINKGATFGGHYHKRKRELFYVVKGAIVLTILNMKENKAPDYRESTSFTFFAGEAFIVEPYESHGIYALEKAILVELLSHKYSDNDTFSVFAEE